MNTPELPRIGDRIETISTPRPVIDETVMLANIARVQTYMNANGLKFRPHIKTHKVVAVARAQVEAGAVGINCQKVTEAEVFAQAGFDDILITFNIMGKDKLARLEALNRAVAHLAVTADNAQTVAGLSGQFAGQKPLTVLVECDTGAGRCGVQTPQAAFDLAHIIVASPGLVFGGLMTYPKPGNAEATQMFFAQAESLLRDAGIACPMITNGGTPSLFDAHLVPAATEHRAGTYVYNDRSLIRAGHCTQDQCAMQILATVVSRPTMDRAVIDAGSKALTSDLLGFSNHGLIVEYPNAFITGLSEEHGHIDLSACGIERPQIGDKIRIIPNHTCVVSNLFDHMVFHRDGIVTSVEPVAARGLVW
jgi:D-serine deaminase-like pyridoxal phosphate-dependent protein